MPEEHDQVRLDLPERDAADELERLRELLAQVDELLKTRPIIDMAKGIIIARDHCTPDEAFDALVEASQRTNRPVVEIARELVDQARRDGVEERSPRRSAPS